MSISWAEVASIIAVAVTFYGIYAQNNYRKSQAGLNFTQADSNNVKDALALKAEYRADLKEMRVELDAANAALAHANATISELLERDRKREMAMIDLQQRFDRDALLRANVEEVLKIANAKIGELTQRVSALEDERDQLKAERDTLLEKLSLQTKSTSGFGKP